MPETIRDIITRFKNELGGDNLLPDRASEILVQLSALYGNVLDEIRQRELEYHRLLLKCYDEVKTANRAKIKAMVSPEYEALQIAKNSKELVLEMCRSLKFFLREKEHEWKMGKNV